MAPQNSQIAKPTLPLAFINKKRKILSGLSIPADDYLDKSPKGSVDEGIRDLIAEINEQYEGCVTTSSCAGRVSVFVEGCVGGETVQGGGGVERKGTENAEVDESAEDDSKTGEGEDTGVFDGEDRDENLLQARQTPVDAMTAQTSKDDVSSASGKGGGKWLYVSHDPVPNNPDFTNLFGLTDSIKATARASGEPIPRLVRLSFEPLILHVLCATLHHAKPLLAAAISSGFRESGVQSLRALDGGDGGAGTMVAVRTTGIGFSSVIGVVRDSRHGSVFESLVGQECLGLLLQVCNERFVENERRKQRFRLELRKAMEREGLSGDSSTNGSSLDKVGVEWEDAEVRRARKREEGLQDKMAKRRREDQNRMVGPEEDLIDDVGLNLGGLQME